MNLSKIMAGLIILSISIFACRKRQSPDPQPAPTNNSSSQQVDSSLCQRYTRHIAGTRTYKKYRHQNGSYMYVTDTSFSISVVNDTTISVWGGQLSYTESGIIGSINGSGVWMPADTSQYLLFGVGGNGVFALEYHYRSDSIVLYNLSFANFDRYSEQ